jgi:hypothetical protein
VQKSSPELGVRESGIRPSGRAFSMANTSFWALAHSMMGNSIGIGARFCRSERIDDADQ